jgi:hypothetical protein
MSFTEYISCTSKTFDEVADLVRKTSTVRDNRDWCIVSIDKVVNSVLEREFEATKASIQASRGSTHKVQEVLAFHGTTEAALPSLLADGFDPTRNIRSLYGIGTYVAPSASFARSYAQEDHRGDNVMLVCRVALGVKTQGSVKKEIDTTKYDYAVDVLAKPNMYVIPYKYGVIPLYIVHFYGKAM